MASNEMDEFMDRTSTPLGEEPFLHDGPDFSGEESGSSSPEPDSQEEAAIFTLLFQECDSDGSGWVEVEKLIKFIRTMQMGEQHADGDEVFDSQEDLPKLQYNLHLLKAMLECNAENDKVNEAIYSHIIKMWVKDVRGRSEKSSNSAPSLEVSQLSDSGEGETQDQVPDWSYGSYGSAENSLEASGGNSSQHSLDRIELMNSVADLKLENKRLQERNQQLQIQMESSEENLKDIQAQNEQLKQSIKTVQISLAHLDDLENDNTDLAKLVDEMREQCLDLNSKVTSLESQLTEAQGELSSAQTHIVNADVEKSQMDEENRALQLLLIQKEEMLTQQEERHTVLESQLHELQHQHSDLSHTIADLNVVNENLKTENADLQAKPPFPLSSTPYRPVAPSLHEELVAQESLMNRGSPVSPLSYEGVRNGDVEGSLSGNEEEEGRITSESFSRILQETNKKINHKHNVIVRELSDMINQPSPVPSRHSGESSHLLVTEKLSDKSFHVFESRLSEILRKKKQLQNENVELSAQVDDLTKRLEELEAERRREPEQGEVAIPSSEASTQISPLPIHTSDNGMQTEPLRVEEASVARPIEQDLSLPYFETDIPVTITVEEQVIPRINEEVSGPPPSQLEESLSSPRRLVNLSRSLTTQHDIESTADFRLSPVVEHVDFDLSAPRDLATGESVVVEGGVSLEELADVQRRHQELADQYVHLEQRAKQLEQSQETSWLSSVPSSLYHIVKGVCVVLMVTVLVLFLLVGLVFLHDAFDSCGTYCPHSPVQALYSMLEPHLQYTTVYRTI